MSYIVKTYALNKDEFLQLLSLIYSKELDYYYLNLLELLVKHKYFLTYNDLYKEFVNFVTDFVLILKQKNLDEAYSFFISLINQSSLNEIIKKIKFDKKVLYETLKLKFRSFLIFHTLNNIEDIILKFNEQNIEFDLKGENKIYQNIYSIQKNLEKLTNTIQYLDEKFLEVNISHPANLEQLDKFYEHKFIKSPFPDLISRFETGRLCLVSGLTKVGKSFFAMNLAEYFWWEGYNVLYISLENNLRELLNRFYSIFSNKRLDNSLGIQLNDIFSLKLTNPKIEKIIKKAEKHSKEKNNNLVFVELKNASLSGIIDLMNKNYDIIIIDWIDLIKEAYSSNDIMFRVYERIIRSLFDFAKERQVFIIAISQLNRKAISDEPSSEYISRSFAKVETADISIILKREQEKYLMVFLEYCRYLKDGVKKIYPFNLDTGKIDFEQNCLTNTENNSNENNLKEDVIPF